jgi:hypothetical protein
MPRAPEPAKISRTLRPSKDPVRLYNILKSASLIRSEVGRICLPLIAARRLPRAVPPIILIDIFLL